MKPSGFLTETDVMHIFTTIADSFAQRLSNEPVRSDLHAAQRIRKAMLELLPAEGCGYETDRLRLRLLVAADATSLWFLRVDLHRHLTRSSCEQSAMQQVQALRPLFEGSIPTALLGLAAHQRAAVTRNATRSMVQ
jgi:hypothetical protein